LKEAAMVHANERMHHGPLIAAGLLLGTGLGGFVDGIVLHQILQWHNMLSSVRPPTNLVDMKVNMVWDGLFHALTWTVTVMHPFVRVDHRSLLQSIVGGSSRARAASDAVGKGNDDADDDEGHDHDGDVGPEARSEDNPPNLVRGRAARARDRMTRRQHRSEQRRNAELHAPSA
jgi:hypothetical protein